MDTEVETLPSRSTRQEGYVEAKHYCQTSMSARRVSSRRRFVFQTTCLIPFFASTL